MAPPRRVRTLNARTRVRERACSWRGLERGGDEPSSGAEPAQGRRGPSSGAEPARGRRGPSSEAEPARGSPRPGHSDGTWGPPRCGPCLGCVLKWEMSCFGFLQVFNRIPLVVLGDPLGCPRHMIWRSKQTDGHWRNWDEMPSLVYLNNKSRM
jgi:hypothetical protein